MLAGLASQKPAPALQPVRPISNQRAGPSLRWAASKIVNQRLSL